MSVIAVRPARARKGDKNTSKLRRQSASRDGQTSMKNLRVMIIEDDNALASALAELIEILGHEVVAMEACESGAIASATLAKPDLMIVDAHLVSGSGVAAVDAITRVGPVPHFFITGDMRSLRTLKPEAIILQKPYFDSDLIRAIALAVGRSY
ncbi:CheY-like chemotaxis protein [Rhodoblastus acidophilus]|uniref:response regulator n=1 Tax=Rhodoblastus acidophilus TaxID=1074 RepID=UPI0022257AF6|nr:response regulator [Rhodoblastus acidophilus]MCW2286724.1 CheY-like chemotaxis protein [Rhodoblastus acidophilus]MCW2335544.1 CheY-like chemotaxis protein [Rhodoblastus acidophilus]